MRLLSLILLLTASTAYPYGFGLAPVSRDGRGDAARRPVLVELFTAEGCPTCPVAERNLAQIVREQPVEGATVIALAFHVDYWDGEGWKDRFASPVFTQRQRIYDRKFRTGNIYTPQFVIDGVSELIGTKAKKARKAIRRASREEKARVSLSLERDRLRIDITRIPVRDTVSVYLAITEDGLSSSVSRGLNAGKDLEHLAVVRRLNALGRVNSDESRYSASVSMPSDPEWRRERLSAIVFIQENHTRRIYGAGAIRLSAGGK